MAKRRTAARPEKRVLAQQEVTRGGRTAAPMRQAPSGGGKSAPSSGGLGRDILAVFAFIGAIGVFCALFTYRREDALAAKVENLIGPMGHRGAASLFGTFGLCAYLVPVALFYTSMALFVRGKGSHRGRQIVGLVVLALSGAVLGHLLISKTALAYPPGGAIGAALGESLRALFGTFGAVLAMSAVAAGALIVATDAAFARLCVTAGSFVNRTSRAGFAWAVAEGQKQFAAWKERQEIRRREKLEEEAAFAQSLADAEESDGELHDEFHEELERELEQTSIRPASSLSSLPPKPAQALRSEVEELPELTDEEIDADEADALAEEAARLARAAEERLALQDAEARAKDVALRAARRVRNSPVADPAWALSVPEAASTAAAAATPAPEVVPAPAAERPKPILALPAQTAPRVSTSPVPAQELAAEEIPLPAPVAAAPAPVVVPPQAEIRKEPIAAVGAVLPVIVEPKAPPKPKAEKKDPFAFDGDTNFKLPPLDLLEGGENKKVALDKDAFFSTAEKLREKLASFGIEGMVKEIRPGPVVTMYEFEPAPGIKVSKIASLADDLAMAMEALKVRIVAPIPGKGVVGIEVPNKIRETVYFRDIVEQDSFTKTSSKLAMAIGKNIEGMPYVTDLAKMPHVLIAGTTGSGKSVSVNAMIMSVLFKSTPEEVRMIMVDPKVTELSIYEGIPHLLLPVVTDARKAAMALRWGVEEMDRRYQLLADAGVRNIAGYNKYIERLEGEAPPPPKAVEKVTSSGGKIRIIDVAEGESEEDALARAEGSGEPTLGVDAPKDDDEAGLEAAPTETIVPEVAAEEEEKPAAAPEKPKKLPYIMIVIDEVADLMMVAGREVETYVARLAQMARAAGIHLMIATQRPSTDVITGVIKANFPSRISFQLRSKPDSMTILGTIGAEALLGMGDMLILPPTSAHLERVHGAYVSDTEIQKVVEHLKAQGKPVYDESILKPRDEEGEEAGGEGGNEEYADEMYDQCLALVSEMRQVSVSMLQRKLRLGYNRAARIIERMEREGVVGPANGSKPREVLVRPAGEMHKEVNL